MSKDTYHHGNLGEALLDAVEAIIDEKGLAGVSLREAARRAGVSHSAPAHHFGDKQGMLTAYAVRGFREFGRRMRRAYEAAGDDPQERFEAIGRTYIQFALENRNTFEMMFREEHHTPDDPALRDAAESAFGVLMDAVDGMKASGLIGDADPMIVALGAWSRVHGMAALWLDGAVSMFTDRDLPSLMDEIFATERVSPTPA